MPFFEMAERFDQDVADFVNSAKRPPAFASWFPRRMELFTQVDEA
jgi:hypothetical protein